MFDGADKSVLESSSFLALKATPKSLYRLSSSLPPLSQWWRGAALVREGLFESVPAARRWLEGLGAPVD